MNIGLSSTPTIDVKNKALKCLGLCFNFVNKIEKIEVKRRGKVRRAKLYYLRSLRGKAARIQEIR